MTTPDAHRDRLATLRAGGSGALNRLMYRFPLLADAVEGRGPLSVRPMAQGLYWAPGYPITDLEALARLLVTGRALELAILGCTRTERQLLALAAWHGGALTPENATSEGIPAEQIDRAVQGLADLLLVDPSREWIVLRPGVTEATPLPGIPVRAWEDRLTSEQLRTRLANLGVSAGSRKLERLDMMETVLRDERSVLSAVNALDAESKRLFLTVAKAGGWGMSPIDAIRSAGVPYTMVERLSATGLIAISGWDDRIWVWLDVLVALAGGRLFDDWSEPTLELRELGHFEVVRIPAAVGRLEQLLDQWTTTPPPGLKGGGLGVRSVRTTAKLLGLPSEQVGLLAALAAELGLLRPVVAERRGRGRSQQVDWEWRVTGDRQTWSAESPGRRWASLVQSWIDSQHLDTSGKAIERYERGTPEVTPSFLRTLFLTALARIPEGSGATSDSLTARLLFEHFGLFAPAVVGQLLEEARILGLVLPGDVVGLGLAGRMLLAGVAELEDSIAGAADLFILQPDHTIIAPPDLHHDITTTLERLTRLESDAGARIYRVTAEDTVRALDAGWTTDEILVFLSGHTGTPLPSNVERTILDAGEQHGRLQVGDATTWVASDDPALLASAVSVRAAKLSPVSPTLAVSELPRDKVVAALRTAGLSPGERLGAKPVTPEARSTGTRVPLRDRAVRSDDEIEQLAARLFGQAADRSEAGRRSG
ncbi:MAG: helicase-associated domain-containing protein [Acidimicrobiia bacterium]